MRLFIFGAGYSGKAIARRLAPDALQVAGTTRSAEGLKALEAAGISPLTFDGSSLTEEIEAELLRTTYLVVSVPPDRGGDPVIPLVAGGLKRLAPELAWIGYLSTVGVYGDHDGRRVDEDTPCRPVSRRSTARRQAETAWTELGSRFGIPTALLRLSGIYGPGRNALRKLASGKARRLVKPGQVFNRIHVADIGGAAAFLARAGRGGIWNITDDMPAPPQDLIACAAELMGVEPPPETDFATADLTPMARSFYSENKRVSNARIKAAGYSFEYPDYRLALRKMWESGEW